jgi:signal transduction histidine kinase
MVPQDDRDVEGDGERTSAAQENDFQRALLAMAGHDLRQPLQVILHTYSWLARHCTQAIELTYIRQGEQAIARMTGQLDHLVEALRLHEHAAALTPKPVALGPLLAEVCRDNADFARQQNLRLHLCPTSVWVLSDAVLLESAVRNLVRNALKYTSFGGRVLVGCRRGGNMVRIEVYDTGVGIPSDQLSKIFEAFHRIKPHQPGGLGLGLFIVRRAVDLLGHRMAVRSAVGRGTRFTILAEACNSYVGPPVTWGLESGCCHLPAT